LTFSKDNSGRKSWLMWSHAPTVGTARPVGKSGRNGSKGEILALWNGPSANTLEIKTCWCLKTGLISGRELREYLPWKSGHWYFFALYNIYPNTSILKSHRLSEPSCLPLIVSS
jgi:hypothetical protein